MMADRQYKVGSVVEMKKGHPCGENRWEVIRLGMDIRLKCTRCGRVVTLPRQKFEKMLKKIL